MLLMLMVSLFVFLALSVPIAVSIGLSSVIAIVFASDLPISVLAQKSIYVD